MKYKIVVGIIILEFTLILLVILATFLSKLISYFKERKKTKIKIQIENYLKNLLETRSSFDIKNFSYAWRRLDILLFIINEYDQQYEDQLWKTIRIELICFIILPLARKAALNQNWILQFYAARSFELYAEEEDKALIAKLINNKVPVIRLAALHAAIKYGSEAAFDEVIEQIQDQPHLTQAVYIQAFANASPTTRIYVERFLKDSSNISTRLTCYRILLNYLPAKIDWDITADLHSENKDLKLAALRYITYVEKEKAIPILLEQLKQDCWESKVVALNALGYLQVEAVIPNIVQCLYDENWWVRLNAALALKNLKKGRVGIDFTACHGRSESL